MNSRESTDSHFLSSTKVVFFLGTPHRGSHVLDHTKVKVIKTVGKIINRQIPSQVESELKPHADESFMVNSQFVKIAGSISIVNFYEQVTQPGLGDLVRLRACPRDAQDAEQ